MVIRRKKANTTKTTPCRIWLKSRYKRFRWYSRRPYYWRIKLKRRYFRKRKIWLRYHRVRFRSRKIPHFIIMRLKFLSLVSYSGIFRRDIFFYFKNRFETIRTRLFFLKYRRRRWVCHWRKHFSSKISKVIGKVLLPRWKTEFRPVKFRRDLRPFFSKIISRFYCLYSLKKFFKKLFKYRWLKFVLFKAKKVFYDKEKICIPKVSVGRIRDLSFLRVLLQSLVFFGRKKLSFKIFFELLVLLKFRYKDKFINNYLNSVERLRPLINYKVMHTGGKKYKIPVLMPVAKGYTLGIRWLVSDLAPGADVTLSLFNNLINLARGEGDLIKHRREYHALAFENKTYIRFLRHFKSGF